MKRTRIFEVLKGNNHLKIKDMTLEELKNGMRDYFKEYKHLMTDEDREAFENAILEVSITKDLINEPSKEKSDYAIVVGTGCAIRLFGKTEEEAEEYYDKAVEDYKDMPVLIYKIYNPYK